MYRQILIPTDGSEIAEKAVTAGIDFAREAGAKVTLFTAVPEYVVPGEADLMSGRATLPADHDRDSRQKAEAILAGPAARARMAGIEFDADYVQNDRPWQAIIDAARRHGCDAIFIGSHGRRGLAAVWHGSETQNVLTHSTIPTLVYR